MISQSSCAKAKVAVNSQTPEQRKATRDLFPPQMGIENINCNTAFSRHKLFLTIDDYNKVTAMRALVGVNGQETFFDTVAQQVSNGQSGYTGDTEGRYPAAVGIHFLRAALQDVHTSGSCQVFSLSFLSFFSCIDESVLLMLSWVSFYVFVFFLVF